MTLRSTCMLVAFYNSLSTFLNQLTSSLFLMSFSQIRFKIVLMIKSRTSHHYHYHIRCLLNVRKFTSDCFQNSGFLLLYFDFCISLIPLTMKLFMQPYYIERPILARSPKLSNVKPNQYIDWEYQVR